MELNVFWPDFGVVHIKLQSDELFRLARVLASTFAEGVMKNDLRIKEPVDGYVPGE